MSRLKYLTLGVFFFFAIALQAADKEQSVDVRGIIFDHVKDSYEWHITTINDKHITIPLPIIVKSNNTGWHIFSSAKLHENTEYNGFYIAKEGPHEGKLVERDAQGYEVRPFDISMTKTVLSLLINSLLLVFLILGVARWYKHKKVSDDAPKGFVGAMEMLIMMIHDDVIKPNVGRDYARYAPYLLTAFFFIFINNLMGILPIFPGGANVTGNIAITFALALCTFLTVNIFGNREYWKDIFWSDVPTWLKVPIPIVPIIELVGVFVKPFALMIRLFANIFAGHAAILAFVCTIFITASINTAINTGMTFLSLILAMFMNCLEFLVAFVQAYVFTMLSSVFIGLSRPHHENKKKENTSLSKV